MDMEEIKGIHLKVRSKKQKNIHNKKGQKRSWQDNQIHMCRAQPKSSTIRRNKCKWKKAASGHTRWYFLCEGAVMQQQQACSSTDIRCMQMTSHIFFFSQQVKNNLKKGCYGDKSVFPKTLFLLVRVTNR